MQCAVIVEAFKPLRITSRPVPDVPDEGLLLKTLYAGICHSDLHIIDDETDLGNGEVFKHREILGDRYEGLVLGHEICGEVVGVGSKVPHDQCHIRVGDTVIVYPFTGCRSCDSCSMGYSNLCEHNRAGTTDFGQGGYPGGYGSYVAVPEYDMVVRLPSTVPPEIGCMLPCSALTVYSAILKATPHLQQAVRMRENANMLIIGAGGLGFWNIFLVKTFFRDKNIQITVADLHDEKLAQASKLGADNTVRWHPQDSVDDLVDITIGTGYNKIDAAIDYVGSPRTQQVALQCLHHGGTVVCVGLKGGQTHFSMPYVVSKTISIQGQRVGTKQTLRDLVELFSVQDIDKKSLPPIDVYKLEDINEAHDQLRKGEIMARAVIKYATK